MIIECINTTEKEMSQEFRLKKNEMNNDFIKEIDQID